MKVWFYFIKTFKENIRDWKILILTLSLGPFFVYLMYGYLQGNGSSQYNVLVLNQDNRNTLSDALIKEWQKDKSIKIQTITSATEANKKIQDRSADLLITIPNGFSSSLNAFITGKSKQPAKLSTYGDAGNVRYIMALAYCDYISYNYASTKSNIPSPISIDYKTAYNASNKSEFDLYFPSLIVFSVIMVLFTAGATLVKEIEKKTVIRLKLTRITTFEWLTAVTLNQMMIGIACMVITLLCGLTVGYHISGSAGLLILVGLAVTFSVIAISIITVCFIRTMFGLLTVGCFPFFILMFFSDCFMPLPKVKITELWGHPVFVNDILPTAVGVRALNKIMNYNATLMDISFELSLILILGITYFVIGCTIFKKKIMTV